MTRLTGGWVEAVTKQTKTNTRVEANWRQTLDTVDYCCDPHLLNLARLGTTNILSARGYGRTLRFKVDHASPHVENSEFLESTPPFESRILGPLQPPLRYPPSLVFEKEKKKETFAVSRLKRLLAPSARCTKGWILLLITTMLAPSALAIWLWNDELRRCDEAGGFAACSVAYFTQSVALPTTDLKSIVPHESPWKSILHPRVELLRPTVVFQAHLPLLGHSRFKPSNFEISTKVASSYPIL